MRTWAAAGLALALGATSAFASEAGHGDGDVAGYIFHHVSDSPEYEFELPGPLYTGHNPKIDLFEAFSFLLIPLSEGACPEDPHAPTSLGAGCLDLRPTKHAVMMWLAALLLIVSVFLGSHRDPSKLVPKGTAPNIFEALVLFIRDEIAVKNIGKEEATRYTPFLASIFFFILFMNFLGLVPWMATATANLAVTCGLAICTFVLTQVASVRAAGVGGYFKHLTGGVHPALWPIMIPVEVLGLFTKPFALTVRLFANMLAGHIVIFFLLGLIFLMHPAMAVVSVPMALGIFLLEIFVALVQAYVFTMLSALFIGMGVAMGHHHHEPQEVHAAHMEVEREQAHGEGARPAAAA